ncbi:hypothetical protein BLA29_007853 [Euroglyphus maynei]|uniref:Uncharacterized protein n=1 Tax=Euroglyphus maynei TaxID=6958 RepID=A0A1Y3B490_EURMA|nr:hypothetical protein BLA29_007853 [Euroglyphus maynei]
MPINYRKGHGSLATSSSPNSAATARSAYRKMSTIDVRSEGLSIIVLLSSSPSLFGSATKFGKIQFSING